MHAYAPTTSFALCRQCGAPVELPAGQTRAQCGHCRTPLRVDMRVSAAATAPRHSSEASRLADLATRDPRWYAPTELAPLLSGARLAKGLERDAEAHWHELVTRLSSQGSGGGSDVALEEQLLFLTAALSEHYLGRDPVRQRALVDTALSLLSLPRHLQVLRAQLARSACHAGDTAAAQVWLERCDAASDDLHADTAYRYACAYLATARGDWATVLSSLAFHHRSGLYDAECVVLHANAWERLSQLATASDLLLRLWHDGGPLERARARRMMREHAGWQLCAQSAGQAQALAEASLPTRDEGVTGAGVLLALSLSSLVWAALAIVGVILGAAGIPPGDVGYGGYALSIFTGLLLGGLLLPISLASRGRERRRKQLLQAEGHTAHILACRTSSDPMLGSEGVLRAELDLLIMPDDAPGYRFHTKISILPETRARFAPGRHLVARFNPARPSEPLLSVD